MMRCKPAIACLLLLVVAVGCDEKALEQTSTPPAGLTKQQASLVLAKVGDKTITVGDFAAALERMNDVNRVRYQTSKSRQELLQQLIDMELLAQEAKRRGLENEPAVKEAVRQILRDVMLANARKGVPGPADITQAEISEYYEAHKSDFEEPERRRVSAIVMGDPVKAEEVLALALLALPQKAEGGKPWGDLYFEHSLDAPKERNPHAPGDLAGDLGLVGPVDHPKGKNNRIPEPVQRAVFELGAVGDIYGKVVKAGNRYYILRFSGHVKGHTRTVSEAETAIRTAILQRRVREREEQLEKDLRKRFPVRIDEQALQTIELPAALEQQPGDGDKPFWDRTASEPAPASEQ